MTPFSCAKKYQRMTVCLKIRFMNHVKRIELSFRLEYRLRLVPIVRFAGAGQAV